MNLLLNICKSLTLVKALAGCLLVICPVMSFAAQEAAPYLSAKRFNVAGQLLGTIAPDPDGSGPLRYLATRNTYGSNGLLVSTEMGELQVWQDDSVVPADWAGFVIVKTERITYDSFGNKLTHATSGADNTDFAMTQYSYNENGRLECRAIRMNPSSFQSLPASACSLGVQGVDGPDRITQYIYDYKGNVLEEHRAVGTPLAQRYIKNTYKSGGLLETVTDANGNTTRLAYDGFGRLSDRYYPDKNTAGIVSTVDANHYEYDKNSNTILEIKRNGARFDYVYDSNNRMVKKRVPSGENASIFYTYDNAGVTLTSTYGSVSGLGIYNDVSRLGNVLSTTNTMGARGRKLTYEYDKNNNRTRLTHHDNKYVDYYFDELNRAYRIQLNGSTHIWNGYSSAGQRSGISRNFGRDGAETLLLTGATPRLTSLQQYFINGNYLLSNYQYNPANQITKITLSDDRYNHLNADTLTGLYTANGLNQYTKINGSNIGYDKNGNLTDHNGVRYNYDSENRLISTSGTINSSFEYDPLGRLFKATISGSATEFLYDGDALVAEYSGTALTKRYIHGDQIDEPLVEYIGSGSTGRRFLHADHQGSIIAVSSESGSVLNTLTYDAFGIPGAENTGRFGYTGQIYFPELGLNYYKARMYNPYIGRFMQTDPIFYEDQMNMYAYVGNDPVNKTDPTGKWAHIVYGGIAGLAGGYVGSAGGTGMQRLTGSIAGAVAGAAVAAAFMPMTSHLTGMAAGAAAAGIGAVASAGGQALGSTATAAMENGIENVKPSDIQIDPLTTAAGAVGAGLGSVVGRGVASIPATQSVIGSVLGAATPPTAVGLTAGAIVEGAITGGAESVVPEIKQISAEVTENIKK